MVSGRDGFQGENMILVPRPFSPRKLLNAVREYWTVDLEKAQGAEDKRRPGEQVPSRYMEIQHQ